MSTNCKRNNLEALPETYERVKSRSAKSPFALKIFTSALLDYAVSKLDAGDIEITAPAATPIAPPAKKKARATA